MDYSGVVGFTPPWYGPHVPWTYSVPYLYGAELGAGDDWFQVWKNALIASGLLLAGVVLWGASSSSKHKPSRKRR
jgi:hypothetical protein